MWWNLLLALVWIALYLWLVRPRLKAQPQFVGLFSAEATIWEKVKTKLKLWWDTILGAIAAAILELPNVLNSIFDAIDSILHQIQSSVDLSAFISPDHLKQVTQGIILTLIVLNQRRKAAK